MTLQDAVMQVLGPEHAKGLGLYKDIFELDMILYMYYGDDPLKYTVLNDIEKLMEG